MQAEIMLLRGSQWLQRFHEQGQSGQTVEQWCGEHHVARSTYYRWKKALREELLSQMETEQGQLIQPSAVTVSQSEPEFAALVVPEAVQEKASTHRSSLIRSTPVIRIKIGEAEIEVPEGIGNGHLEMVLWSKVKAFPRKRRAGNPCSSRYRLHLPVLRTPSDCRIRYNKFRKLKSR